MENKLLVCVEPVYGSFELWERIYNVWARTTAMCFISHQFPNDDENISLKREWFAAGPEENGREVLGEL